MICHYIFHDSSSTIYDWLQKQPNVKEESLTDWLLYYISDYCPNIYYHEFSRREEADNGADWEWWILTSNRYNQGYNAYRFLVQAKKLLSDGRDNYSLLSYGNKNGYQIDLLMKAARYKNAFPLYMFYSIAAADIKEQMKEFQWLDSSVISWCDSYDNGCYLSPASKIYSELYDFPRHKLKDANILNKALKLSLLDMLFESDVEDSLSRFNREYVLSHIPELEENDKQGVRGIRHFGKGIPHYLKVFVDRRGENVGWLQAQMQIDDIDGIGVLDFRDIDENR